MDEFDAFAQRFTKDLENRLGEQSWAPSWVWQYLWICLLLRALALKVRRYVLRGLFSDAHGRTSRGLPRHPQSPAYAPPISGSDSKRRRCELRQWDPDQWAGIGWLCKGFHDDFAPLTCTMCVSVSSTPTSILVSYFPWFTILSCNLRTAPIVPAQSVAPFAWATSSPSALAGPSGWRWRERERG